MQNAKLCDGLQSVSAAGLLIPVKLDALIAKTA